MSLSTIPYPIVALREALAPLENGKLLQQGWSPQCHPRPANGSDEWGVLKTTAIQPGAFNSTENKALPETLQPREHIAVQAGDLVMTNAGPRARCGVPALVRRTEGKRMLSGKMYRFRPNESFDPDYLELWLLSPQAQKRIDEIKTGINESGLNLTQSRFLDLPIPKPPLSEQRRIVELATLHLAQLKSAQSTFEHVKKLGGAQLKSMLWIATHSEGQNVLLKDIAEIKLGRQRSPKNHSGDRMVPYLRAANVDWNTLRLDDVKSMNFTKSEQETFELQPGDILLTEASGSPTEVGKSVLYEGSPSSVCFQNTLLRVRCTKASPRYVQKYLLAEAMAGRFMEHSRGVGIHHLGRARLASLSIWLPDPQLQLEAAMIAEEAVRVHQLLQLQISNMLGRIELLRLSILTAAFEGRLMSKLLRTASMPSASHMSDLISIPEASLT